MKRLDLTEDPAHEEIQGDRVVVVKRNSHVRFSEDGSVVPAIDSPFTDDDGKFYYPS